MNAKKNDVWQYAPYAVLALFLFGGKTMIDSTKATSKARGIRNNNPGNLVKTTAAWQGKVPHSQNTDSYFEQFIAPEWGIRAMFIDIRGDITKKGQNTVRKLMTSYAPPPTKGKGFLYNNNTAAYIGVVSKALGKSPDSLITPSDYFPLLRAIIKHENGVQPYSDEVIQKGIALA